MVVFCLVGRVPFGVLGAMVPGSKTEGGGTGTTHLLSARVRKTIQSIKEIVGNHSDADIYVALKEANMDPNETTQKLLNQGSCLPWWGHVLFFPHTLKYCFDFLGFECCWFGF